MSGQLGWGGAGHAPWAGQSQLLSPLLAWLSEVPFGSPLHRTYPEPEAFSLCPMTGYLPNGVHAVEAMLAAASIGAIWSSTSPDFGVNVSWGPQ